MAPPSLESAYLAITGHGLNGAASPDGSGPSEGREELHAQA